MLSNIREILRENQIRLSTLKSQHFIINENLLEEEVEVGDLRKGDEVVEVGSGIGNLTKLLASKSRKVICVEKDEKFIPILKKELKEFNNLQIINEDILNLDIIIYSGRKIISNPPYHISSPLLMQIIDSEYKLCVITLQLEFAKRLVANPGDSDYSRLSVRMNYNSEVKIIRKVGKGNFYPMPKVDSALVSIKPAQPTVDISDKEFYFSLINNLFNHKNQLVRKVFKNKLKKTEMDKKTLNDLIFGLPHKKKRVYNLGHSELKDIHDHIINFNEELKKYWII
jgi:16S rRNA (adenine1518-N6/adenine1519-N6)-dimethyltransferase